MCDGLELFSTVRTLLLVGYPFAETFHMEGVPTGEAPSDRGLYLLQADSAVDVFTI